MFISTGVAVVDFFPARSSSHPPAAGLGAAAAAATGEPALAGRHLHVSTGWPFSTKGIATLVPNHRAGVFNRVTASVKDSALVRDMQTMMSSTKREDARHKVGLLTQAIGAAPPAFLKRAAWDMANPSNSANPTTSVSEKTSSREAQAQAASSIKPVLIAAGGLTRKDGARSPAQGGLPLSPNGASPSGAQQVAHAASHSSKALRSPGDETEPPHSYINDKEGTVADPPADNEARKPPSSDANDEDVSVDPNPQDMGEQHMAEQRVTFTDLQGRKTIAFGTDAKCAPLFVKGAPDSNANPELNTNIDEALDQMLGQESGRDTQTIRDNLRRFLHIYGEELDEGSIDRPNTAIKDIAGGYKKLIPDDWPEKGSTLVAAQGKQPTYEHHAVLLKDKGVIRLTTTVTAQLEGVNVNCKKEDAPSPATIPFDVEKSTLSKTFTIDITLADLEEGNDEFHVVGRPVRKAVIAVDWENLQQNIMNNDNNFRTPSTKDNNKDEDGDDTKLQDKRASRTQGQESDGIELTDLTPTPANESDVASPVSEKDNTEPAHKRHDDPERQVERLEVDGGDRDKS